MRLRGPAVGWLLFGAALALRVGWVLYCWLHGGPEFEFDDEQLHWQLASNLVRGGELVSDDGRYAARMPVYPLFLGLFAWLGEVGVLAARLAQALLGATATLVAYRFARAVLGARVGLVAGLLVCWDPYAIFVANLLLAEALFILIGVGLTACAWQVTVGLSGTSRAALSGVALLGPVALMTRPSAAGWVLALWALLWIVERDRRRGSLRVLVCAGVLAVLMLPWGLRNRAVLGSFAWLSANGGVTLYDAQGPQADGRSDQAFLERMPELAGLGEVQRDRVLYRLAVEQMKTDPARVLRLAWVKFRRTWNPVPNLQEYRSGFRAFASAVFTGGVLGLAAVGLARSLLARRRLTTAAAAARRPPDLAFHLLLWLPVVYFTLVHCIYVGSLRYRIPLMPFVELAAAAAFVRAPTDPSEMSTANSRNWKRGGPG